VPARNGGYERCKSPAKDLVLTACELLVIVVTICLLAVMLVLHS
jgi:hypothetical protein